MPIPTAELRCGMILVSDKKVGNLLDTFKIVKKVDDNNTVLGKVTWSASRGYKDVLGATFAYVTDDHLRAQYSIIVA